MEIKIGDAMILPDGSGCFTASFPLPEDHWLTKPGYNTPPMTMRCGTDNPLHPFLKEALIAAGRYAVRCATMNGKEDDFDPDALIQNLLVGAMGYNTGNGLSSLDKDENGVSMWDPKPVPKELVSITFDAR